MKKEELEKKLQDLVKRTLALSNKVNDIFNESRDLKIQGAAVDKALADLESGKSEDTVLDELEETITTAYAKDAEEMQKEADYAQKVEEELLKKDAEDEASK